MRILRPPVEQGSAASVKLEKTPTLTNESVIQLVEAGFSEGTIIKRIEKSPVEFDLSPAKLIELRKRRVTETDRCNDGCHGRDSRTTNYHT